MSSRTSSLLPLLLLAACSRGEVQPQGADQAQRIECALGEGSAFGPDCLVENAKVDGRRVLVVREPDGGFRRFEELSDGSGVKALDGADEARLSYADDVLEVAVGDDRYRFPARSIAAPDDK